MLREDVSENVQTLLKGNALLVDYFVVELSIMFGNSMLRQRDVLRQLSGKDCAELRGLPLFDKELISVDFVDVDM